MTVTLTGSEFKQIVRAMADVSCNRAFNTMGKVLQAMQQGAEQKTKEST